ncbi:DUF3572 domain-containing protein [Aquibium sp. LZ166]|uniref:DUF3572 domain-containing protein n=1 Tax=Aquibium pacificus TaxID=3153579 RepID=A0ABV3SQX7_9HYPH
MKDVSRPPNRSARAPKPGPDAEALAVGALSFIASDPVLMPRFLAMSGIEASDIRRAAAEPGFLAGVLNFLLAHEPSLMAFCDATGADPGQVGRAAQMLPGGDENFDRST